MGLTGFHLELVNQMLYNLQLSYERLIALLGDDVQSKFIGGMSDKWAGTEATDYFNQYFKENHNQLMKLTDESFKDLYQRIISAATRWANRTKTSYNHAGLSIIIKQADTSIILENINGVRGIDMQASPSVLAALKAIGEAAKSELDNTRNILSSGQEFLDDNGEQTSTLVELVTKLKNAIQQFTAEVINEADNAISKTIEAYGQDVNFNKSTFGGN